MADYGITGFGAYTTPAPRSCGDCCGTSLDGAGTEGLAKGERAFCSWDEDSITMAVDAARDCLGLGARDGIGTITLASTTLPYASLQNSAIVAGALALGNHVRTIDMAGSQRAGVAGLAQALRGDGEQIFVTSDRLRAKPASPLEMSYGAGAAAFRIGRGAVLAKCLGSGVIAAPFVDHFRATEASHDYFWEERWIRDEGYAKLVPVAVRAALADARLAMGDLSVLAMASPLKGAVAGVAKTLGFAGRIADSLDAGIGYAGTAHPLLMLAGVLETARPGERILVIGFGQGAEAVILEITDAIDDFKPKRGLAAAMADALVTTDYLRMLSFYRGIDLDWGMRGEATGKAALTTLYREADQLAAFVAGKCTECGTVQFPQLAYCVNPECHAPSSQFTDFPLTDEPAHVLTHTSDWLSYHPAPPLVVGFVQFDVGARLLMEMVDVGADGIDTGTPLRIVCRIKETDRTRGFNRYFWKATPLAPTPTLLRE